MSFEEAWQARHTFNNNGVVGNQVGLQNIHGGVNYHFKSIGADNISKLQYAPKAAFNSSYRQHKETCLPGTRSSVCKKIRQWANNNTSQSIFWILGMAGTGKSTIALTIAREFYSSRRLGASFFFARDQYDISHGARLVPTIAFQLSGHSAELQYLIDTAIHKHRGILEQAMQDQWKHLIIEPLSKVDVSLLPLSLLIVVDALDECRDKDHIRLALRLFTEATTLPGARLQFLVTSRPDWSVESGFFDTPNMIFEDLALHEVPRAEVDRDLEQYFRFRLHKLSRQFKDLPSDWPCREDIQSLVSRASGLFIYASTVCNFIEYRTEYCSAEESLSRVLSSGAENPVTPETGGESPTKELDFMYTQILQNSVQNVNNAGDAQRFNKLFKLIIGTVITLEEPLSSQALYGILRSERNSINPTLRRLGSVLYFPRTETEPIQLLHPSFREYLLDPQRCTDNRFAIQESLAHSHLLDSCLQLMTGGLKRNMCELRTPSSSPQELLNDKIERFIPSELQYACRFWICHVKGAGLSSCSDAIHSFLRTHFLYWLEALSLLGKLGEAVLELVKLRLLVSADEAPGLYAMVYDGYRFTLANTHILESAPLQLYFSALMFTPTQSLIRQCFISQLPKSVKLLSPLPATWGSHLQTLIGHTDGIPAIAFSPDGQLLASASEDKTVRLWDAKTGRQLQTLEGHTDRITAIAFSPDGQLLVSASEDKTVRLWDRLTGARRIFTGQFTEARELRFAAGGLLLVTDEALLRVDLSNIHQSFQPISVTPVSCHTSHEVDKRCRAGEETQRQEDGDLRSRADNVQMGRSQI